MSGSPHSMLDAAVIGGGPVGLAVAAALLQAREPALNVQVFERVDALIPCGAGISLMPNGFRALNAIHPKLLAGVRDVTVTLEAINRHTATGEVTRTDSVAQAKELKEKYGFPAFQFAGWSDIRGALANLLPPGTVQLGKKFASLQQHDGHVEVQFTDGTSIKARAVIGADGNFSKVRQQSLDDGLPEYTGMTSFRARLPWRDGFPKNELNAFHLGKLVGFCYSINKGNYVWSMAVPDALLHSLEGQDGDKPAEGKENACNGIKANSLQRAQKLWGDGPAMVSAAMNATDPSTVLEHKIYIREASSLDQGHWGVGWVTLAGDAAHPMRATNGQGLNQGLEDAAELGRQVRAGGLSPTTLRSYETTRIARVQQIMAAETASGLRAFSNSPEHLPDELAKYKYAKEVWATGLRPDLDYFDWLLRDSQPLHGSNSSTEAPGPC